MRTRHQVRVGCRVTVKELGAHWSKSAADALNGKTGVVEQLRPELTSDNSGRLRALVAFDNVVIDGHRRFTGFWFFPDELEVTP